MNRSGSNSRPVPLLRAALVALLIPLLPGLTGCAGVGVPAGDALLRGGDPAAAVTALTEEEALHPDDGLVKRNLGVAMLESGDAAGAATKLAEAATLLPDDAVTRYFLGRALETTGDADGALKAYGGYLALTDKGSDVVRARIRTLAEEKARRDVAAAIARESSIDATSLSPSTVAVPEYANVTASTDLAPLSRGLAVVLLGDLARVQSLRVVERERMDTLLDELHLGAPAPAAGGGSPESVPPVSTTEGMKARLQGLHRRADGAPYYRGAIDATRDSVFRDAIRVFQADHGLTIDGIAGPRTQQAIDEAWRNRADQPQAGPPPEPPAVDPATAPRLGKLLGAGTLVLGSFAVSGQNAVELSASLATVADGSDRSVGPPVSGPTEDVLRLQKQLTFSILAALGVEPTPAERREIETLPTKSFGAFLAYCRGLDYEAAGRSSEALDAYREALRQDPGFGLAHEATEVGSVDENADASFSAEVRDEAIRGGDGGETEDRLIRTGGWIGQGPGPDLDRGDDLNPEVTPAEKIENGTLVIEGDLPPRGPGK